jgi:hypothetical protein
MRGALEGLRHTALFPQCRATNILLATEKKLKTLKPLFENNISDPTYNYENRCEFFIKADSLFERVKLVYVRLTLNGVIEHFQGSDPVS